MKSLILALLVTLVGCGTEDSAQQAAAPTAAPVDASAAPAGLAALALEKRADLPQCDNGRLHQLIYVRESSSFFTCDDGGNWTAIDVDGKPGKDGAPGATGPEGAAGQPGVDGQAGADGQDGHNGVDGGAGATGPAGPQGPGGALGLKWTDPASGKMWLFIGWLLNGSFNCGTEYATPTTPQMRAAIAAGIGSADGPDLVFTLDVVAGTPTVSRLRMSDGADVGYAHTSLGGFYCVER